MWFWSAQATRRQALGLVAVACLLFAGASGCGGSPRKGAFTAKLGPRIVRPLEAAELLPQDLDLVVRVDVARMRSALGPTSTTEIARRALKDDAEPDLMAALACADVVWIGTRAGALESGDRVIVVEGRGCLPEFPRPGWTLVPTGNGAVSVYDRGSDLTTTGTAEIVASGHGTAAFVTAAEVKAVRHVLEVGPDEERGTPRAEGVVSLDLRIRPLPPRFAKRYPSLTAVLGGLAHVQASATLDDTGLKVDAAVVASSPEDAARASRFIKALAESLNGTRYGDISKATTVDLAGFSVLVHLVVPTKVVLGLVANP